VKKNPINIGMKKGWALKPKVITRKKIGYRNHWLCPLGLPVTFILHNYTLSFYLFILNLENLDAQFSKPIAGKGNEVRVGRRAHEENGRERKCVRI